MKYPKYEKLYSDTRNANQVVPNANAIAAQAVEDPLDHVLRRALEIGVFDAQQIRSAMAAREKRSSREKVSLSISLPTVCPHLKACRRANSSNQPRRWRWYAGCGARSLLGH